ncbi:BamA/TamA family outer membrane protein [Limibacter armeniacum]|uniref:translocation and assembly module lipoprotein TamL n=1 Tax=Limibacter armeniacum TaxID=466084 RepID=UPI002FE59E83
MLSNQNFNIHIRIMLVMLLAVIGSCSPTKQLKEGEYLLFSQEIKGASKSNKPRLEQLIRQKPNRKILGVAGYPYLEAYRIGKKRYEEQLPKDSVLLKQLIHEYDSLVKNQRKIIYLLNDDYEQQVEKVVAKFGDKDSLSVYRELYKLDKEHEKDTLSILKKIRKIRLKGNSKITKVKRKIEEGNWLMRSVGEPPSIYDGSLTEVSRKQIEKHLKQKGYFDAEVTVDVDTTDKKVSQVFNVTENTPSKVRIVDIISQDTAVHTLIAKNIEKAPLKESQRFEESRLEKERDWIYALLRKNGYYDFNKGYIYFEVDTGASPNLVDVSVLIDAPENQASHDKYIVDEIVFETDVAINARKVKQDTVMYEGVAYLDKGRKYSKRVLDSKVLIEKNAPYSEQATADTRRVLGNMDIFKFVNVNYEKKDNGHLKAHIFASSLDKYQYSFETGLNVNDRLPGPFASFTFKNRNVFNGAEVWQIQGRYSLEAQASASNTQDTYTGQEIGLNSSLIFPRVMFPLSRSLRRKYFARSAQTKLFSGISYTERPEYTRLNLQGGLSYQWRNRKNALFNLSLVDLSVINTPFISEDFDKRLSDLQEEGNNLIYSFDNSFVSSVSAYYSKAKGNYGTSQLGKSSFLKLYAELGGTYLNLLGQRFVDENDRIFGLRYFRFMKFYADLRQSLPIIPNVQQLASRLHIGMVKSYGDGVDAIPYEKYFFTGGSNSNRAWRPRRIGPGSFTPDVNPDGTFDYSFEQPGEIIMEANLEWRAKLFSIFNWAFFLDASNVWTFNEEEGRPGSQFQFRDFWKEFAVGYGFGLRLDFSYLLIRFDVGLKMYDPARPDGAKFVGGYQFFGREQAEYNLAIGYPF